jgi:hypothetical protein
MPSGHPEGLLVPIAKARRWFAELSSRQVANFAEIAARDGCSERYVRSILQLAFLAPEITRFAVDRRLPERSGVAPVLMSLPVPWHEQTRRLGLAGL